MTDQNIASSRVFFLHIPKAGGTTFYDILYRNFGYRQIAKIDGTHVDSSISKLRKVPAREKARYRCIAGHMTYGLHEAFEGPYRYVTFLRAPVERVTSLYFQIRNVSNHPLHERLRELDMSLDEFVRSDLTEEIDNDQTRRLAGADDVLGPQQVEQALENMARDFSLVGLTEHYDLSLALLSQSYPKWDMSYVPRNTGHRRGADDEPARQRVRAIIRERNRLDEELYERVSEQFYRVTRGSDARLRSRLRKIEAGNRRRRQLEERLGPLLVVGRKLRNRLRPRNNL